MAIPGAFGDTPPASDAFSFGKHHFRHPGHRFGIMAPGTAQGTAFHEYRGADTRPVVDGKTLYTENDAHIFLLFWFGAVLYSIIA